jgi:hypothetical protein
VFQARPLSLSSTVLFSVSADFHLISSADRQKFKYIKGNILFFRVAGQEKFRSKEILFHTNISGYSF